MARKIGFTIICWGLLLFLGYFIDPNLVKDTFIVGSYSPFFLLAFFSFFSLATLILRNSRRGFLVAVGVTGFLVLRMMRLGNVVNAFLLLSLVAVIDFYLASR